MTAGRIYQVLFSSRSPAGIFYRFAPKSNGLKIVFFGNPSRGHLKIMSNGLCVGFYEQGVWHLLFPWRLWIDPAAIEAAAKRVELERQRWTWTAPEGRSRR
jgi:hypothetical protein